MASWHRTVFETLHRLESGEIKYGREQFKNIGSRMNVADTIDDVYSQV